jgi:hypothetical protein
MKKGHSVIIFFTLIVLITSILLSACGQSASSQSSTPADGQTLLQERCSVCHSTNQITRLRGTTDQWTMLVDDMIGRGAQLNTTERQTLIDYLAQTYK